MSCWILDSSWARHRLLSVLRARMALFVASRLAALVGRAYIGTTTMFYLASKILFLLIDPPAFILILLIIAWILHKRSSRVSWCLHVTALIVLFLTGCPTTSQWWVRSLESQFIDKGVEAEPTAEAIVVLGGSISMPSEAHPSSGLIATSDRLLEAMRLYRAGKAPIIVATGGDSPLDPIARPFHEADEMRNMLVEWGVPNSAILVETKSINTHENAIFTHQLLESRKINRVILVTSAIHMPRAQATFRKAGFEVHAAPANFLSGDGTMAPVFRWLPVSGAMVNSSNVIREWIGLWVYRLRDWA